MMLRCPSLVGHQVGAGGREENCEAGGMVLVARTSGKLRERVPTTWAIEGNGGTAHAYRAIICDMA